MTKAKKLQINLFTLYCLISFILSGQRIFRFMSIFVVLCMFINMLLEFLPDLKKKKYCLSINKLALWIIMVGLYFLLSYFWCSSTERYSAVLFFFLESVLLALALIPYLKESSEVFIYVKRYIYSLLIMSLYMIVKVGVSQISRLREYGTLINGLDKNYYSMLLLIASLFCFYFGYIKKQMTYLWFLIPFTLIIFGTGSRKALIFLVIGMFAVLLFGPKENNERVLKDLFIIVLAILLLMVVVRVYANDLYERIIRLFYSLNNNTVDTSARIRSQLFHRGFELIIQRPVLGFGMNNFSYYSTDINIYSGYMYAHNNYIELLSDFGIIGFILFYWIFISIAKRILALKKHDKSLCVFLSVLFLIYLGNDLASVSYYMSGYIMIILFIYSISGKENLHDKHKSESRMD